MPRRVPSRAGHCRWAVLTLLAAAALGRAAAADPPEPKAGPPSGAVPAPAVASGPTSPRGSASRAGPTSPSVSPRSHRFASSSASALGIGRWPSRFR